MKTIEYTFEHPEHAHISTPIALAMQNLLEMDVNDEAKTELLKEIACGRLKLEYETQDMVGVPFRGPGLLHIDSQGFPHTTSFFATSTPATTARGQIVLREPVEGLVADFFNKKFSFTDSKTSTLYLALTALYESFGVNWLVLLQNGGSEVAEKIGQYIIVNEIEFKQVPPFSIATGYVEKTLHKSSPRRAEDPRARIFGGCSYFR